MQESTIAWLRREKITLFEMGDPMSQAIPFRDEIGAAQGQTGRNRPRNPRAVAKEREVDNVEFHQGDALKLPLDSRSVDAAFCVMVLHFLPDPQRAIADLCRITRPGGSVILVDLVQHKQDWMREQMAHQWLGFDRALINRWFREGGAASVDYDLTGSFAGEKIARNGNRPVEIFVARASLPAATKRKMTKAHR